MIEAPRVRPAASPELLDRRIRISWRVFGAAFLALTAVVVLRLGAQGGTPLDWLVLVLLLVAGGAGVVNRQAVAALESGRRAEAESFARILSGLSRSVSPDAILTAIVDELARATEADQIVVVRRRPDARVLDATLISARPGVRSSSTLLPIADLEDPVATTRVLARSAARAQVGLAVAADVAATAAMRVGADVAELGRARVAALTGGSGADLATAAREEPDRVVPARGAGRVNPTDGQLVADRIAARVRSVYGLQRTLAAPLSSDGAVVGAIVLSHRTGEGWSATTQRLLAGAAEEASAALARAYSHRDAEARASTDALTGLPNRRYFDEFCGLLARRRRAGDAVGVLMIDIDRFKVLNDTFGHGTGDEVLRAVSGAIVGAVREDDVPARFGGEEFVVLLRNPGMDVAVEVGERVRSAVGALDLSRWGVPGVSVSVGVAVSEHADQPIDDLIERADQALYRAKRAGRDRVVAA